MFEKIDEKCVTKYHVRITVHVQDVVVLPWLCCVSSPIIWILMDFLMLYRVMRGLVICSHNNVTIREVC